MAASCGAPALFAQDTPPAGPGGAGGTAGAASQDKASHDELVRQLAEERAARLALEKRLAALEAREAQRAEADIETQLRGLLAPDDLAVAPPRTIFPGAANPKISVFMDAKLEGGNFDSELGEDSDRFSLRETEVDFRLPVSPFAEGVLIIPFEDEGNGDFASSIEEGYASIGLGTLLDTDWKTVMKLGRFRPQFGRNNQLHTHDWLQVNQPLPVQNLLGAEGIVGDGFNFDLPLWHSGEAQGQGRTTSLNLSLVNGEMLTGGEGLFGELADDAGLALDSDGPLAVARLSHYVELGTLSDIEFGVSHLRRLDNDAITTDAGSRIEPSYLDADVTWRSRDDETGIGSWLLQAELIRTDVDYGDSGAADFPEGSQDRDGWWLTAQRQLSPSVYLGLLYARSDTLGSDDRDESVSPYLSWYPDEFFRIRWQVDRQSRDVDGGADVHGAYRALVQFTWNFGVHQPHPYWVNR